MPRAARLSLKRTPRLSENGFPPQAYSESSPTRASRLQTTPSPLARRQAECDLPLQVRDVQLVAAAALLAGTPTPRPRHVRITVAALLNAPPLPDISFGDEIDATMFTRPTASHIASVQDALTSPALRRDSKRSREEPNKEDASPGTRPPSRKRVRLVLSIPDPDRSHDVQGSEIYPLNLNKTGVEGEGRRSAPALSKRQVGVTQGTGLEVATVRDDEECQCRICLREEEERIVWRRIDEHLDDRWCRVDTSGSESNDSNE